MCSPLVWETKFHTHTKWKAKLIKINIVINRW
jgi:hypothetical protein